MTRYLSFTAAILFGCVLNFLLLRPALYKPAVDFAQFYLVGELISNGKLADIYDTKAYEPFVADLVAEGHELRPFVYFNRPAFSAPLYWAYSFLPYTTAARVFLLLNFAVWGFMIWKFPIWLRAPSFLRIWMVSLFPVACAIGVGQDTLGLTVIAAYSLCVLVHRNEIAAGTLLGVGLIKPHLFVLVPILLFAERKYKALAAFLATGVVLAAVSVAFVGVHGIEQWIQLLGAPTTDYHPEAMGTIRALGLKFNTYVALAAAAIAVPAGILAFRFGTYNERLSVAIIFALVLSPHTYWGDYALLSIVALTATNAVIRYAILLPWAYFAVVVWPMVLCTIFILVLIAFDAVSRNSASISWQHIARKFTRGSIRVISTTIQ